MRPMNRKIVSLTTAVILTVASAVPVFAASSPSTTTVMTTPVTVTTNIVATKGYVLTAQEEAAIATTPEEATALAAGVAVEGANGAGVVASAAQPGLIALAKADILKNAGVQSSLSKAGVAGLIVNAGVLANADGAAKRTTVNLSSTGLVPGEKVAILYYIPGDPTPHVVKASWKNGKLSVTLPLPCVYNIVK